VVCAINKADRLVVHRVFIISGRRSRRHEKLIQKVSENAPERLDLKCRGASNPIQDRTMKKLGLPITLTVVLLLVYIILQLPEPNWMGETGLNYLYAALLASASFVLVRAIGFVLFDIFFKRRKGHEAPALLRDLFAIVAYFILFMMIYSSVLKRDLSALLATSAVVTVIIGLALQDTLGNFFAGISFHIEEPFHIGDAIRVGDTLGRVEAVTWRTTTIRTNNNTLITFPNSRVARESLEIFPLNNLNRRILRFPAPYSASPHKIIPLVREIVRSVPNVAAERAPVVRVGDFSDSSITYEVLYWVKDYMWHPDIDAKIRERVWYAYRRSGIEVPFPIRHVLLETLEPPIKLQEMDYERVLEEVDIFEPLTQQEKEMVIKGLVKYVYAPGEVILRRGDPGDSMFVICRGKVEVRLPGTDGHPHQVAVLGAGDFFGEMALFTGEPRAADVSAAEETEVLEIRKSVIQQLLHENTGLAEAFSRKITERQMMLSAHLRSTADDVKRTEREKILQRIKRFFGLH